MANRNTDFSIIRPNHFYSMTKHPFGDRLSIGRSNNSLNDWVGHLEIPLRLPCLLRVSHHLAMDSLSYNFCPVHLYRGEYLSVALGSTNFLEEFITPSESPAIVTGPSSPPSPNITERLVVNAVSLNRSPPIAEAEDNTRREPAFFQQRFTLPAAAGQQDFTLPEAATGELATVQIPLGSIARPGDDYRLDGRLTRFYRAPEQPVIIDMQGERAQGYQETAPG
jgi:hypothetical protein